MDRTEKLISILRDQYEMKIQSNNDGISCDGGKLMNLPFRAWVFPQLCKARFFVVLKWPKEGSLLSIDLQYRDDFVPLEVMIEATVEKFINEINRLMI